MERPEDKTILVVDDEPNVREYLATVLQDAGFNVVTAGDGAEALEIIRENPPDFISLDLIMPRKSGHKLMYELRKHKQWSRIPVLVVTAHAQDELGKGDLEDLLENRVMSGPGTYLEKPVNPASYVRSIQRALGIEETENATEKIDLKEELQKGLQGASPDALRMALEALKQERKD
ncbi:MAG: response regulator [Planctomycetes bacterium]|nr:response regulator [Planctomycetota bacterium]